MAIKQTRSCDWLTKSGKPHDVLATTSFQGSIGKVSYAADLCEDDAAELGRMLIAAGVQIETVLVDSKPRRHYVGDSGVPFTTSVARKWLIDEGHWHAQHGRIPEELLALYAADH